LAFLNIPLFVMLNMPISFILGRLPTGGLPTTSPHLTAARASFTGI
jgi:hypothetical protein